MNWRPCDESFDDPLMQAMTNLIVPHEGRHPNLLPNLRTTTELVMASDYSGEHSESPFQVVTYLLATDESIFRDWNPIRRSVREHFLTDGRRFAFKSLNDQSKQKAVVPFLRSVDEIDGVLVSVAIHKGIEPLANMHPFAAKTAQLWKPEVWEKLLRIGHFGAVLVGGLAKAGQVVRWMMDDDAIIANERLQKVAGNIISKMFARTCHRPYGQLMFGIASHYDDDRLAEDLVAICDLAGGATAENHSVLGPDLLPRTTDLLVPMMATRSTKTQILSAWLSSSESRLAKLTIAVRQHAPGQLLLSIGQPEIRPDLAPVGAPLWLPPDKGWKKSSEWWWPNRNV